MSIVLCPGIHDSAFTTMFWDAIGHTYFSAHLRSNMPPVYVVEDAASWGFSPSHVLRYLHKTISLNDSLVFIGFSAGVVGAIGAAWAWHQKGGGKVTAFLALDGWGVPLYGPFPIYRLSHDPFTHWSGQALGRGQEPFYADPGVSHLDLWRSPDNTWGWWECNQGRQWTNAADVICQILLK